MGMPFLAEYSKMFEDGAAWQEVVHEFEVTRAHLRDPVTGLYKHAWDEARQQAWADPNTGLSQHYWARGMGWFAMALVDVLEIIPEEETELRAPLLQIVTELAVSLELTIDSEHKTWWQIMDMPSKTGNYRESSASSMFVYFLAKALNNGYLPERYHAFVLDAYQGIISEFILPHANGEISMTNQCLVAGLGFGRDGSFNYYMSEPVWSNDPKGTGPFILASLEVHKLLVAMNL